MRLADLLADSTLEDLQRMAHDHAKVEEQLPRPQLLATIESVLRSHRFLQEFLFNRQPPTWAIMTLLLDDPKCALPTSEFEGMALAETRRICAALDSHDLLERDDQLRIYRRVLYTARSNDMQIDSSESDILALLREELRVAHAEHCVIEHHADLREFWQQDGAFRRELDALRAAGLVFVRDALTLLPEDLVSPIRRVLGIDMAREATRRLFHHLSGTDLYAALQAIGAPTSGSKGERIERLVDHMAQPRVILLDVGLDTLRAICRETGAAVSGSKEELVNRIVDHLAAGRDLVVEVEAPPPAAAEVRRLSQARFRLLFARLRGRQLGEILEYFDLPRSGTKELRVQRLWEAQRSEITLLECLSNPELEVTLRRVDLKTSGSKSDRIERLISFFESLDEEGLRAAESSLADEHAGDESSD